MKILTAVALSVMALNIAFASQADAAFLDFTKDTVDVSVPGDQNWSFDSLYQNIQGFSLESFDDKANAVASVTNPVAAKPKPKKPARTVTISASGYSSTPDQTDDTPFITAKGTYVRDGVVATNFLPFGTIIKIPEIFGNKLFIVEDRMNKRYWYNVDVWFPSRELAKEFGRKTLKIEIVS